MSSKIISNLFWFFAFLCALLLLQTEFSPLTSSHDKTYSAIDELSDKKEQHRAIKERFPKFCAAYKKLQNQSSDETKMLAIKEVLTAAKSEGFNEPKVLQSIHLMEAQIHQDRWHFVYAIESLKLAQNLYFEQKIASHIKKLRRHLNQVESERGLNDSYIATKYSGPAKQLKGKVVVAYIYVDDGISTRWSNKTRHRTEKVLEFVQNWQVNAAHEYGVNDLNFVNRSFIARKNPMLKAPRTVSFESSGKDIENYVTSVMASLGEKSVGDFIEKQIKVEGADQGVVILHVNFDQRSFAQRCGYTHMQKTQVNGKYQTRYFSQCNDEYVMLMEQVKRNRWDKMHYAQAHEMMHVFGAADLYNIKNANDFAVTDIMNFQSKLLDYSQVEPITAYAIGWLEKKPNAPFDIIEK